MKNTFVQMKEERPQLMIRGFGGLSPFSFAHFGELKKATFLVWSLLLWTTLFAQKNTSPNLIIPIGHSGKVNSAIPSPDGTLLLTASTDGTAKLWDISSGILIHTLTGHEDEIYSATFSPDGRYVLTASADYTVRLWETQSGAQFKKLTGHSDQVLSAHFSPDGQQIVSASLDGTAKIWSSKGGKSLFNLKGHSDEVYSAKFSADGRFVVTASKDQTAKIWKVDGGKIVHTLKGHGAEVTSASFSPDGSQVVTTSKDRTAKLWECTTGTLIHTLEGDISEVEAAAFSPDSRLVITCYGETATIWDVENGVPRRTLEGHLGLVYSATFSPDGSFVATSSMDMTTKLWGVRDGKLKQTLTGHESSVQTAAFNSSGDKLFTASSDHTARLWDLKSGEQLFVFMGYSAEVSCAEFNFNGSQILTGSQDKIARIWQASSGELLHSLKGHSGPISSAIFSPNGTLIATASSDGTTILWDAKTGAMLHQLKGHSAFILSLSFSSDGRRVVSTSWDQTAKIWDTRSGKLLQTLKGHSGSISSAYLSPDGTKVVTSSSDLTARIWDVESGRMLQILEGHKMWVQSAVFTPDGSKVLSTSFDNTAKLWNTQDGSLFKTIDGYNLSFEHAGFSPDGRLLFLASYDGAAVILDVKSGETIFKLKEHKNSILTAKFSPDGSQLVTTSSDGTLLFWDLSDGKPLQRFSFKGIAVDLNFDTGKLVSIDNSVLHHYELQSGRLLFSVISVKSTDFLLLHPENYFDGTEQARDLLYFVCDGEVINLAQMKDALYVPGLVGKIMSGQEINSDKLEDLGICDALPVVNQKVDDPQTYTIIPRRLGLDHVEVYINDKLVFNFSTDDLVKKGATYELVLEEEKLNQHYRSGARNTVKVVGVVKTENGFELQSRGIIVPLGGRGEKSVTPPRLFAVMIGVNDHKDPNLKLNYPVKDAIDLGRAVETAAAKFLGKENVFVYQIHSEVKPGTGYTTPEKVGIKRALEDIGKKARPEDVVLMFFAGHGEMQGADGKVFTFLTADASKSNPVGISTKELQDWLSYEGPHKMLANKTILIFDACNSGQATSEFFALARNDDNPERIRQVEDLKDKSGMFILAGSAPNQAAYELPQYQQGMLTYSLLSVLKNNPTILDNQQFLNVQKWFLESEQKLKEEVESKGLKQDAKPFGTANIRIGIVDEEVRSTISLANEKAVLYCDNIIESESAEDILQLKELLSKQFSGLSNSGSNSSVFFTTAATKQANRLNILYTTQEDKIVANLRLRKGEDILLRTTLTGLKSDLDGLVKEITEVVVRAVK